MEKSELGRYNGKVVELVNVRGIGWGGVVVGDKFYSLERDDLTPRGYGPTVFLPEEIEEVMEARPPKKSESAIITAIESKSKKVVLELDVNIEYS